MIIINLILAEDRTSNICVFDTFVKIKQV